MLVIREATKDDTDALTEMLNEEGTWDVGIGKTGFHSFVAVDNDKVVGLYTIHNPIKLCPIPTLIHFLVLRDHRVSNYMPQIVKHVKQTVVGCGHRFLLIQSPGIRRAETAIRRKFHVIKETIGHSKLRYFLVEIKDENIY